MNERIETLEVEFSYARRLIEDLSEVVAAQGERIAVLEGQLQTVARALSTLRAGRDLPDGPPDEDPPPPHY